MQISTRISLNKSWSLNICITLDWATNLEAFCLIIIDSHAWNFKMWTICRRILRLRLLQCWRLISLPILLFNKGKCLINTNNLTAAFSWKKGGTFRVGSHCSLGFADKISYRSHHHSGTTVSSLTKKVSIRNSLSFLDNNWSPLLSALNRLMSSYLLHLNYMKRYYNSHQLSQLEDNDNHSTAAINLIIFLLKSITTISTNHPVHSE